MLKKTQRISSKRLISLLFKKGNLYNHFHFKVRFLPSLHSVNQFAVVVSKKVSPKAVQRNRIKRQLTEIIRLELPRFHPPLVALILVKSSPTYPYELLHREVMDFLRYYPSSIHV